MTAATDNAAGDRHCTLMAEALATARSAWGMTHPNPMVGALIVEQDEIVARGVHRRAGQPHAEVDALQALGRAPSRDATLYVTLEPCSTHGRTPPCYDAIREAGIRHVVYGTEDPNPDHAGRGLKLLREAGVRVTGPVLRDACVDLNLIFNHAIVTRRPLVAVKVATTLDGKIATRTGHSRWITGPEARQDVMRWRRLFPAIAVGANTVIQDNPSLTARLDGTDPWSPRRIVLDGRLRLADHREAALFRDRWRDHTVVVCRTDARPDRIDAMSDAGISLWPLPPSPQDHGIDFAALLQRCYDEGLTGLFVEGGRSLISSLLSERRAEYLFAYRAPVLLADALAPGMAIGGEPQTMQDALRLTKIHHATFGPDQLLRGRIVYPA